jgi:hypothetical protein
MIELSYYKSVFKNPGYVTEGETNMKENHKEIMKEETLKIIEKVLI